MLSTFLTPPDNILTGPIRNQIERKNEGAHRRDTCKENGGDRTIRLGGQGWLRG